MNILRLLILIACMSLSTIASAQWREASTKHFRIFSDGSERELREAASELEQYWFMLGAVSGARDQPTPIKLKVYLVRNTIAVQQFLGLRNTGSQGVAGFYRATIRGPLAVSGRRLDRDDLDITERHILFHEIAHHFMFQNFAAAYPPWYVEGFADYYGASRVLPNSVIEVGHTVPNRYMTLRSGTWIPVSRLLAARSGRDINDQVASLYAQGWLLTHYLSADAKRAEQLRTYLRFINAGSTFAQARDAAFGDLARLDRELRRYANQSSLQAVILPFKPIDVGPVEVRNLSAAEIALIRDDVSLSRPRSLDDARSFAAEVAQKARRFPNDPYALSLAADAYWIAGDEAALGQIVDTWLRVAPVDPLALMYKGNLAAAQLAEKGSEDPVAWNAARKPLLDGIRAAPNEPRLYLAYYDSFLRAGVLPPAGAQNGLMRALELVPQDDVLRYIVAADFEARDMVDEAIATIKPAAYEVHERRETAEQLRLRTEYRARFRTAGEQRIETAADMLRRLEQRKGVSE